MKVVISYGPARQSADTVYPTAVYDYEVVAKGEDGSSLRLRSPQHIQDQTLSLMASLAQEIWPNCQIQWVPRS
jgi:hypothetical protein